jgi:histidinol phosphatase-like enzyme (inositol monophosphatase family)
MDVSNTELATRFEHAKRCARQAGKLTLKYYRQGVDVERKADASPVTVADREAEQLLRREITDAFPKDAILGEEYGETAGTSGFRWILDPIDGTKSFISGVPLFGTLVGIEHQGEAVAGVIEIPVLAESVAAARGGGAWFQFGEQTPVPAKVATSGDLGEGLFVTTQRDSFDKRGAGPVFTKLESRAAITRTWGDCYGYLLVATGRALLMVDPVVSVWDAAALQPVIQEAGGAFTDWSGAATIHSSDALAATRDIIGEVIEITRPYSHL